MTPVQFSIARHRLGLSKLGLAEALGAARNTISAYEDGRAQIPKYIELAMQHLLHLDDELGSDPLGDHHGENR